MKVKVRHCYSEQGLTAVKTNRYDGRINFLNIFTVISSNGNGIIEISSEYIEFNFVAKYDFEKGR